MFQILTWFVEGMIWNKEFSNKIWKFLTKDILDENRTISHVSQGCKFHTSISMESFKIFWRYCHYLNIFHLCTDGFEFWRIFVILPHIFSLNDPLWIHLTSNVFAFKFKMISIIHQFEMTRRRRRRRRRRLATSRYAPPGI